MTSLRLPFLVFLQLASVVSSFAQSTIHRQQAVVTNNSVSQIITSNGYTLIRGSFNQVGPYAGNGVTIDKTTGNADLLWPKISGDIQAVVSDGNGGWYVGGYLYGVDNEDLGNLVHILPNKRVDRTWTPVVTGVVYALALKNNILYIGGSFLSVLDEDRMYAAAINVTSGEVTSWNPRPNNPVTTLEATDDAVFIAGNFTAINNGTVTRTRLAKVSRTTGEAITGWSADVTGATVVVEALIASDSRLFIGGLFQSVKGVDRNGLAAVSITDGNVAADWNPNPATTFGSPRVHALALDGNTLFVGGSFNDGIGGDEDFKHLAAVSATGSGNLISAFNPELESFELIHQILVDGTNVIVSGTFNEINGTDRNGFAALNKNNGALTSWESSARGYGIQRMVLADNQIYIAGELDGINWLTRDGRAIISEATGTVWPHQLLTNDGGDINAMVVAGTTMYIGGSFTEINGIPRKNLAAIDLTTGNVLAWAPQAHETLSTVDNTTVNDLVLRDNTIYVAGIFRKIDTHDRLGLAAINATTGAVLPFNPSIGDGTSMDEYVFSMDIHGENLYVAGTFDRVAGEIQPYLAAINLTTGTKTSWDPQATAPVWKIRVGGNAAYLLGEFGYGIGGTVRFHGIAAVDLETGDATDFDPQLTSNSIGDFALTSTDIYIGSYFESAGGEPRPGLASFSLATGELNSWDPDLGSAGEGNYDVQAVAASNARLYVGGSFKFVGKELRSSYAEYDLCGATSTITLDGTTLVSSPAASYQWFMNGQAVEGATSQSFQISLFEYGVYAVEVNVDGCTGRSADYVYLVTGDLSEVAGPKAYPNPVVEKLVIEVPSAATVTIYDINGRIVNKSLLSPFEPTLIETSEWPVGLYIARVSSTISNHTYKIIKSN